MPSYEYNCTSCDYKKVIFLPYSGYRPEWLECPECGAKMRFIFPKPTVIQTGYKPGDARYNRGRGH